MTIVGPHGYGVISVCERCGILVPPDRDGCPNGPGVGTEITDPASRHPIVQYIRSDVAAEQAHENGVISRADMAIKAISLQAIEAAESCLEAAKAGLRR